MRTVFALTAVIASFGLISADDKKDPTVGNWVIQSVTRDGKADAALKDGQRSHGDGKYTMARATDAAKPFATGSYALDASKTPMTIDLKPKGGTYDGKTLLGIVKVDGDVMTIAFAEPGKDRPTAFESKAGSGVVVAVHKKAK